MGTYNEDLVGKKDGESAVASLLQVVPFRGKNQQASDDNDLRPDNDVYNDGKNAIILDLCVSNLFGGSPHAL